MPPELPLPFDPAPFTSPPAGYLASESIERLEQAWLAWRKNREQLPPDLMDFLPEEPSIRDRVLPPLAEVHFEYGLDDGQWGRVEGFLERYRDLKSHVQVLTALVALETRHRRDNGDTVSDEEYWRRFPPFAALQVRDDFEKAHCDRASRQLSRNFFRIPSYRALWSFNTSWPLTLPSD